MVVQLLRLGFGSVYVLLGFGSLVAHLVPGVGGGLSLGFGVRKRLDLVVGGHVAQVGLFRGRLGGRFVQVVPILGLCCVGLFVVQLVGLDVAGIDLLVVGHQDARGVIVVGTLLMILGVVEAT